MTTEFAVGIDLGTTGLKLTMIDATGAVQASVFKAYPIVQPRMAWAEQDPKEWTRAVVQGLRELVVKSRVPGQQVLGVGIASQIDGVVAVDGEGDPLGNAIIWMDRRAKEECNKIRSSIDDSSFYSMTGLSIDPSHMAPKLMWIKNNLEDN